MIGRPGGFLCQRIGQAQANHLDCQLLPHVQLLAGSPHSCTGPAWPARLDDVAAAGPVAPTTINFSQISRAQKHADLSGVSDAHAGLCCCARAICTLQEFVCCAKVMHSNATQLDDLAKLHHLAQQDACRASFGGSMVKHPPESYQAQAVSLRVIWTSGDMERKPRWKQHNEVKNPCPCHLPRWDF